MVKQAAELQVPTVPAERSFLPRQAQPWEIAMILFGVPGATASAVAISAIAMYAVHGDALLAACAGVVVLGGYLGGMAVLGLGVAGERAP
jgi:hypothetical protein